MNSKEGEITVEWIYKGFGEDVAFQIDQTDGSSGKEPSTFFSLSILHRDGA